MRTLVFAAAFALFALASAAPLPAADRVGEFVLRTVDGVDIHSAEFTGRALVVNVGSHF